MKKILRQFFILVLLCFFLILPYFVFATNPTLDSLVNVAEKGGNGAAAGGPYATLGNSGQQYAVSKIAGQLITAVISLLGVIFLGLMIYGGYIWMTARGEEEKVKKSQDIIRAAIIGLIIIIAAYAITKFVEAYIIQSSQMINGIQEQGIS